MFDFDASMDHMRLMLGLLAIGGVLALAATVIWVLAWARRQYCMGYLTGQLDAVEECKKNEVAAISSLQDELAEVYVADGVVPPGHKSNWIYRGKAINGEQ